MGLDYFYFGILKFIVSTNLSLLIWEQLSFVNSLVLNKDW
jgi:hypothetical protein